MLMIRLQRVGRKNDPSFRVVITDSRRAAQTGRIIEIVGSHDARSNRTELKAERITHWLSVGAKTSNTVHNLLIKKGIITGKTIDVSSKKKGQGSENSVNLQQKPIEEKGSVEEQKPIEVVENSTEAPVSTSLDSVTEENL